jgi:hypothetical protein
MIHLILIYWVFYVLVCVLFDVKPTFVSQRYDILEKNREAGAYYVDETDSEGFAWAMHGLTKD